MSGWDPPSDQLFMGQWPESEHVSYLFGGHRERLPSLLVPHPRRPATLSREPEHELIDLSILRPIGSHETRPPRSPRCHASRSTRLSDGFVHHSPPAERRPIVFFYGR